jgi:hypothetical protein
MSKTISEDSTSRFSFFKCFRPKAGSSNLDSRGLLATISFGAGPNSSSSFCSSTIAAEPVLVGGVISEVFVGGEMVGRSLSGGRTSLFISIIVPDEWCFSANLDD